MDSQSDGAHFERVLRVLEGERVPIDPSASKVLQFMLESSAGCDAVLLPERFEIRFGWYPARHRYFLSTAPKVLSYLLEATSAGRVGGEFQAVLNPGTVQTSGFPQWSFNSRRVWIQRGDSEVAIMIREAEGHELSSEVKALPEPIDYPPAVFVELPETHACPTCSQPGSRFRELDGGFWICGACGCSFPRPDRGAAQAAVAADAASARR
jgi:hypothetical protein